MSSLLSTACRSGLIAAAGISWLVGISPAPTAAASLPPADHLELKMTADSLWAARSRKETVPLYRQIVESWPADGESRLRLAVGLSLLDRNAEAAEELKRCHAEGFAETRNATYQLATVAAEQGRTDEALELLDRALAARLEERPELQTEDSFAALRENPRFRRQAGFLPAGITDRRQGWAYDLDFFLEEARRLHAAPDRPAFSPEFSGALSALKGRIDELDDVALAIELQKLVVRHLRDGHSLLLPIPTPRVQFGGMLPLQLYVFSDGVFVVGAAPEQAALVGRRVSAIGGKPVTELLAGLRDVVSRDNDQGLLWTGPTFLGFPALLRALGAAESSTMASLTLEGPSGSEVVTLQAAPFQHPRNRLPAGPGGSAPAWLTRVGENYWHEARPDLGAWYAQFNQVQNAENGPTIRAWVDQLRSEMSRAPRRDLIIDLRHNNGGNNFLIWPLVRLAAWHEMSDPANRTWVITGRNTFSACQNLANFLDRVTGAIFIGEPSSSKPNFTGEDTHVQLPWSGLRFSISSRYWQDSFPGDDRPYLPVAMPVTLSSTDWKANRDPVLEALGEYLRR